VTYAQTATKIKDAIVTFTLLRETLLRKILSMSKDDFYFRFDVFSHLWNDERVLITEVDWLIWWINIRILQLLAFCMTKTEGSRKDFLFSINRVLGHHFNWLLQTVLDKKPVLVQS